MSVKLTVLKADGKAGTPVTVSEDVFGRQLNESLVHEVITAVMANRRSDTSMQKNRSDRRGGGCKPWQQKGLGRARAGSIRSPLWRGGGVTFGSQQSLHHKKVNKKAYKAAMRSMVSELVRLERLVMVKSFELKEAKTKQMKATLDTMGLTSALIVLEAFDEPLYLASRNIPHIDVGLCADLDPVALLSYDKVVITEGALKQLEERLS
jgi:large subunit ribosomal protein L4